MAINPLLKPQSSLDYLNQSPMPSGASSGATTSTILTPPKPPISPTFSPNTQSGGGSWTSPQIAQATPAPTIAQAYQAPAQNLLATPENQTQRRNLDGSIASVQAPAIDFSQDALTPQANVSGSVGAMLGQVQPAQKPFVNTYWDPGLGRYVEGNMETDRPWEKYGLGSANALYNTDPQTLRALQQRNTIGGQYGEYLQSQIKPLDEEAIRRQTIDRFQAEIDAMNRYYAEKTAGELAREQEAGRARVGTRTAISARRGMLGGDFGDAARETVVRYNQDVENRIVNLNEKERIFQELQMRGAATKAAEAAIDKAKAELESAYEKSQKWQEKIKGEIQERVTNRLAALALDGTEMTDDDYQKIARELGIDVDTVKATALAMRPTAEKPLVVDGVAYQRQADGTYKAITPSDGEKPLIVGGVAYQRQPDGSYSPITPTEAQKPLVVDGVIYERDASGNYVAKTPTQGTGTKAPETVKINGVDSVWDGEKFVPVTVQSTAPTAQKTAQVAEIKRLAQELLASEDALGNAVGAISNRIPVIKGSTQDFIDKTNRLKALLTTDNIGLLKGVLSDSDMRLLERIGTSLNLGGSEEGFKAELNRIVNTQPLLEVSPSQGVRIPQSALDEARRSNPTLTEEEIVNLLSPDFPSVGGDTKPATAVKTGALSQRFESSGDPGAIGYDSTGGWSYGTYQLAHNNAKRFVEQSPYSSAFAGVPFNSQAWRDTWKRVAKQDPQGFANAQQAYIERTHLQPQITKLASQGVDLNRFSPVMREVVFSTAVQHGPGNDVVEKAVKKVGPNAPEDALIKAIYEERWAGGKRFASSTPRVRQAVYNRFFGPRGELNTALSQLA